MRRLLGSKRQKTSVSSPGDPRTTRFTFGSPTSPAASVSLGNSRGGRTWAPATLRSRQRGRGRESSTVRAGGIGSCSSPGSAPSTGGGKGESFAATGPGGPAEVGVASDDGASSIGGGNGESLAATG